MQANVDKFAPLLIIRNYIKQRFLQYLYILRLKSLLTVLKNNFVALREHISTKVLDHVRLKVVPIACSLGAHLLELLFFLGLLFLLFILLNKEKKEKTTSCPSHRLLLTARK